MRLHAHYRPGRIVAMAVFLIVAAAMGGCERAAATAQSAMGNGTTNSSVAALNPGPAPVVRAPLLLLDEGEEDEVVSGPEADNNRCFVCHINYTAEPIAADHARRNVGCADCHGASDAHIADESWGSGGNGTAPDVMYPKDKINPACMTCHPKEKIDAPHHEPAFAAADAKVCTDCHGDHRLSPRRCKWR